MVEGYLLQRKSSQDFGISTITAEKMVNFATIIGPVLGAAFHKTRRGREAVFLPRIEEFPLLDYL